MVENRQDDEPRRGFEKSGREHEKELNNPDPITDEAGSHPFGVAGGGAGGAAAGAAIGAAVGGPAGALVGGAVGAVAGGVAGKGVAEMVNPTEEEMYWRTEYRNRPYFRQERGWDYYEPAYRYGWESAARPENSGRPFEEVEPDLSSQWSSRRGTSVAEWPDVRDISRDAYERVHHRSTRPEPEEHER